MIESDNVKFLVSEVAKLRNILMKAHDKLDHLEESILSLPKEEDLPPYYLLIGSHWEFAFPYFHKSNNNFKKSYFENLVGSSFTTFTNKNKFKKDVLPLISVYGLLSCPLPSDPLAGILNDISFRPESVNELWAHLLDKYPDDLLSTTISLKDDYDLRSYLGITKSMLKLEIDKLPKLKRHAIHNFIKSKNYAY